jgi:general stress protein 26
MSLNDNPAVKQAYEDRSYTDAKGDTWRRGLDGWFLDGVHGPNTVMLVRHDDFVDYIEKEHPKP